MKQVLVTPAQAGSRIEIVMPAYAGIQRGTRLDFGVRRNDGILIGIPAFAGMTNDEAGAWRFEPTLH